MEKGLSRQHHMNEFKNLLESYGCTMDHAPAFYFSDSKRNLTPNDIDNMYKLKHNWSITCDIIKYTDSSVVQLTNKPINWIDDIKKIHNSTNAVNLAQNMNVNVSNITGYPIEIFSLVTIDIPNVIKMLLINWKDAMKAEELLMKK